MHENQVFSQRINRVAYWIVLALPLLLAGCAGVCIVDVPSASVIHRRGSGSFREKPVSVTADSFTTLQRDDKNAYIVRTVGFDGKEVRRSYMPLFTTAYGGSAYSFSEDGTKMAFVNWEPNRRPMRLNVCSVTNLAVNLLPAGVCDHLRARFGYTVMWLDEDTILIYPNVGSQLSGEEAESVQILHLGELRLVQGHEVFGSNGPLLLSPSKRYLMATEDIGDTLLGKIHILDLSTGKVVYEVLPSGEKLNPRGIVWRSDDEIIYSVDNRVVLRDIHSACEKDLFETKPNQAAELFAVDAKHNLHYQIYDDRKLFGNPALGWRVYNLRTRIDHPFSGKVVTGGVFMNPARNVIVAEVGF